MLDDSTISPGFTSKYSEPTMRMIPFSPSSSEHHLLPIRIVPSSSMAIQAFCVPSASATRIDVEPSSFARNMPPPVGDP